MIVISDTSPLNYLVLIQEIDLLQKLFGKVIIPQAVFDELHKNRTPAAVSAWIDSASSWIEIRQASNVDSTLTLGSGECEAISLAQELNADLILLDDRKARKIAIERGLAVAGTLNILEAAAKQGLVDLPTSFQALQQTNFRVSDDLLQEILKRNITGQKNTSNN